MHQLFLDVVQLRPLPFRDRDAPQREVSALGLPADVREPQKVEGLGLAEVPLLSLLGGESPKLDQPRLLSMQFQAELREPVAELREEPLGVISMLEARHVVISKPHENDLPA